MNSSFSLEGKTVLVTGGAGFLGRYFVEALHAAGARVGVADSNEEAARSLAAEYGDAVFSLPLDVTLQDSVDAAFKSAVDQYGAIDVVINNAAIDPKFDPSASLNEREFTQYPEDAMRQSVEVNMLGYWRVAKAAVAHMKERNEGHIINISSIYGLSVPHQDIYPEGTQKPVDYGMTKAAIQYLTRYIAGTYGKDGIRSNALVYGGVLKGHDSEFQEKYGHYSMLGRMVEPGEVAPPLVFLASDAARGMTGHLLVVDGGFSAW